MLELSADYSWAYFNIAQIYWELNRTQDAMVMLSKTLEKNPKDIEVRKLMAQILIKEAKLDEVSFVCSLLMHSAYFVCE